MSQITPITGLECTAYRAKIIPEPIQVGELIPNVHLSRFAKDGKTVINFSTGEELSKGRVALFCVSKTLLPLSNAHLSGIVKAAETFKQLNVKTFCLAVNTRTEMFSWGRQYDFSRKVELIPDSRGDFSSSLGIWENNDEGCSAKRSAFFLNNGIVLDVQIEKNSSSYSISNAQNILTRIPSILERNKYAEEIPGSLEEVLQAMEKTINPPRAGNLFNFLCDRMKIIPDPIEAGETVPNVRLSRFDRDGRTVIHFSTGKELSEGRVALFCVSKAFLPLSNAHLSGIIKTAEAFKKLNVKIFCLGVNTRTEMFSWGRRYDVSGKVEFIPDSGGDFSSSLGIWENNDEGYSAKRSAMFLNNGIVLDVQIEKNSSSYTISNAQNLLNKIPSVLEKNKHAEEIPGSLEEVLKAMETYFNPPGADRLFNFLRDSLY